MCFVQLMHILFSLTALFFSFSSVALSQLGPFDDYESTENVDPILHILRILGSKTGDPAYEDIRERTKRARLLVDSWSEFSLKRKNEFKDVMEIYPILQTKSYKQFKANFLTTDFPDCIRDIDDHDSGFGIDFLNLLKGLVPSIFFVPLEQLLYDLRQYDQNEILREEHVLFDLNIAGSALEKFLNKPTSSFAMFLLEDLFLYRESLESADFAFPVSTSSAVERNKQGSSGALEQNLQLKLENTYLYSNRLPAFHKGARSIDMARGRSIALGSVALYALGAYLTDLHFLVDFLGFSLVALQSSDFYLRRLSKKFHQLPLDLKLSRIDRRLRKKAQISNRKRNWVEELPFLEERFSDYTGHKIRIDDRGLTEIASAKVDFEDLAEFSKRLGPVLQMEEFTYLQNLVLDDFSDESWSDVTFHRFIAPLELTDIKIVSDFVQSYPRYQVLLPKSLREFLSLPLVQDFVQNVYKWGRTDTTLKELGLGDTELPALARGYLSFLKTLQKRADILVAVSELAYFPLRRYKHDSYRLSHEIDPKDIVGAVQIKDSSCSFYFKNL